MVANATEIKQSVKSPAARVSAQILCANRRNAKKSTGPRTEAGKSIASRNALVHGVHCADTVLMPGESQARFLMLRDDFVRSLKPANAVELMLVERIAISQWKVLRLRKHEQCLYERELSDAQNESRECLAELEQVLTDVGDDGVYLTRELADKAESAPRRICAARMNLEMIEHETIPVEWIQARQWADEESSGQLERLSRLEHRLEASIDKAMRELERMRAGRWRRDEQDDPDLGPLATLRYQLDREDVLEISAKELKQAKRAAREIKTVQNEATAAEEADKLRVKQGLEEEEEEPADTVCGADAIEEHQADDEPVVPSEPRKSEGSWSSTSPHPGPLPGGEGTGLRNGRRTL